MAHNKLGMMLCVSMCACFQLRGRGGEEREGERGAEEGGYVGLSKFSPYGVIRIGLSSATHERLIKSG